VVFASLLAGRIEELLKSRGGDAADGESSELMRSQASDARRTLILDLSSKVTEQQTEILHLRDQLRRTHDGADVSETSTVGSELPGCSWWKSSDTGLSSRAHHNAVGNCRDASEETSGRLRHEGRRIRPPAATSSSSLDTRVSQLSVDSCRKKSSEPQPHTAVYRAHWASSCFDVQDEVNRCDDVEDGLMGQTVPASEAET